MSRGARRPLRWIPLASVVFGCAGGTETGNPPFDAKLSYSAYSSAPAAVSIGASGAGFDVTALWMTVGSPKFVVGGTCGGSTEKTLAAPGLGTDNRAVDSAKSTTFRMPAGAFCAVEIPFDATPSALPASAPAELAGHSLMIEGTLANGTRVSILDDALSLELASVDSDFSMSESEPDVVLAFDVATWFAGLDLSAAEAQDGTIRISKTVNADLLAQFEARLKSGVQLFRDENGDGLVDANATAIARAK